MPKETSAGAIIFRKEPRKGTSSLRGRDNKIYYLLLHYESGHWDFPKGRIEQGEKEEETVKREVKEETGIEDIEIIEGFKEWIKYFYRSTYGLDEAEKKKIPWTFKIVTFYLAETKTPHQSKHGAGQAKEVYPVRNGASNGVKISFEHIGYEWLPYKEALERVTYKNAKEILKKAHHYLINYKLGVRASK